MSVSKRLTQIFKASPEVDINDSSKIIICSDCHRGDNSRNDNFAHNQNLFFFALNHYYENGFDYIELGDGDELWEIGDFKKIWEAHSHIFWLLQKFHDEGRLHMIWGNHDAVKLKRNIYSDVILESDKAERRLLEGVDFKESLNLCYKKKENKIFCVHGHQGDAINDCLWKLGRFLVRNLWKNLEKSGYKDPTSPAKNHKKKDSLERKIVNWVRDNNQMLIAGHTHKPVFPDNGEELYFNAGSCVHPRCITGIEIIKGTIVLIKWWIKPDKKGALTVTREELVKPLKLQALFSSDVIKE